MRSVHNYLATVPFDIYELALFHLVVKHRSFSRAAEAAGLTQSAVTRQMQGLESSLGIELIERTTRSVRMTPAGEFLYRESLRLLGDVESILQRLREEFGNARREVRVGVSRTVGLAYLPGFLHAHRRRSPEIGTRVSYLPSVEILAAMEANDLDLGVLCAPPRLPRHLCVTHRFRDAFTLVAPAPEAGPAPLRGSRWQRWAAAQSWLLIGDDSTTGQSLRRWFRRQGWTIEPAMESDSFDLIINLVAVGMGVSFVPIRALALYGRKRGLQRMKLPVRFERELVVVMRKHRKPPEHLTRFVQNILF
ncbi:MAG: LysR family transcriptional regulator [Verrucomicrobiota bacterium]|nr:LysR family transcriptional regulator [Verrucomicrobiota bacterium]